MAIDAKRKKGVRRLSMTLDVAGKQFPFTLCHRELHLEETGTINYFWMDSRKFRKLDDEEGIGNFRSCLGLWWWLTMQHGLASDPVQQQTLLLATSYQVVFRSKGLQHILNDAHLTSSNKRRRSAQEEETAHAVALPDEDHRRIRNVIESRNRHLIKREIDQAFGLFIEPDNERYFLTWMFEGFLAQGRQRMQGHLLQGLDNFANSLERFVTKWRRRGNADFEHRFIDMLSYECKAAFYLTYANAWRSLVGWLEKHEGIDVGSQRFLRLWHNQNQPIELRPPAGDPHAPTHRRDPRVAEPGLDYLPDIFSGQVLSLHPLSGIVMNDPALLSVIGRFVRSPEYEQVMSSGCADTCPTYWSFLEVILIAANQYRLMRQSAKSQRGRKTVGGNSTTQLAHDNAPLNLTRLFEEYTGTRRLDCACGGRLCYGGRFSLVSADTTEVIYRCQQCDTEKICTVHREDLISDLFD